MALQCLVADVAVLITMIDVDMEHNPDELVENPSIHGCCFYIHDYYAIVTILLSLVIIITFFFTNNTVHIKFMHYNYVITVMLLL